MSDNFDLDAVLGSKPKGDHFDLDAVLSAGKPRARGPQGYLSNAWEALKGLPAGLVQGPAQEVLYPSVNRFKEGIATLKEGDAPILGLAQLAASVPGAEYVANLSGKASQAIHDLRQGNVQAAVVNAAQAIPGVQTAKGMQDRFYDRAVEQFVADPSIKIATNPLGELHGNLAGYALLDKAPGVVADKAKATKESVGKLAQESAVKSYEQVLGATTKDNKRVASQITPELVDRGVIAPTRKSLLEKFKASAEDAGAKLDDALAAVPENLKVDVAKAQAKLEKLKEDHLVKASDGTLAPANDAAASSIEAISSLQADMKNLDPSFGSVRKFRQILDRQVTAGNKAFGRTIREGSTLDVTREGANAIRSVLAEADPNVAALNKELSFWLKAKDVLGATVERTASQAKPLSKTIAEGAVAAGELASGGGLVSAGIKAKMIGTVSSLVHSTAWRTTSAAVKGKIAKALMTGDQAELSRVASTFRGKSDDSAHVEAKAPEAQQAPAEAPAPKPAGVHPGYQALVDAVKGKTQAEALKILAEQEVSSFLAPGILERAGVKAPEAVSDVVTRPHPGQRSPAFVDERLKYLQDQAAKRGDAPAKFAEQVAENKSKGAELAAALEQPKELRSGPRMGESDLDPATVAGIDANAQMLLKDIDVSLQSRRGYKEGSHKIRSGDELDLVERMKRSPIKASDLESVLGYGRKDLEGHAKGIVHSAGRPLDTFIEEYLIPEGYVTDVADFGDKLGRALAGEKIFPNGANTGTGTAKAKVSEIAQLIGESPAKIRDALIRDKSNPIELKARRVLNRHDPYDAVAQAEEAYSRMNPDAEPPSELVNDAPGFPWEKPTARQQGEALHAKAKARKKAKE